KEGPTPPIALVPVPNPTWPVARLILPPPEAVTHVPQAIVPVVVIVPPVIGEVVAILVTVPQHPPPPARAEAVDVESVSDEVPLTSEDMRIRTAVYPATFACQVPVEVVEVAAVVLF